MLDKHKCRTKWFTLSNEHGRDHSNLILTENSEIFYYRRQDGRVQLMMKFESATKYDPNRFTYKAYIGDVSWKEFKEHFTEL